MELNKGVVSLIIPCYNGERYIKRCLDCVLAQTYKKIELIIVNDGSTDNSRNMINDRLPELKEALWNVIFINQENAGVGAAVNKALKYFSGEYIALLDIDDYMMPDAIMIKYNWLEEHRDYSAVRNNGYRIFEETPFDEGKLLYEKNYRSESEDMFNQIIEGTVLVTPATYMIRADKWLERCPDREIFPSRNGQNLQIIMPAAYKGKTGYISKPLMKYYVHNKSLSHFENDLNGHKVIEQNYKYCELYIKIIDGIIDENDKNECCEKVNILFTRKRMNISLKYNNKKAMKQHYNELKKLKKISIDEYMVYAKLCHPFIEKVLSLFHKRDSVYLKVK